jgi:hypothetical protein
MVEWNLCPACHKVVDEFEDRCGWCFFKENIVKSDEKQLLLFDLKVKSDKKDYLTLSAHARCANKTEKEKNV